MHQLQPAYKAGKKHEYHMCYACRIRPAYHLLLSPGCFGEVLLALQVLLEVDSAVALDATHLAGELRGLRRLGGRENAVTLAARVT